MDEWHSEEHRGNISIVPLGHKNIERFLEALLRRIVCLHFQLHFAAPHVSISSIIFSTLQQWVIIVAFMTRHSAFQSVSVYDDLGAPLSPIHRWSRGLMTATGRSGPASRTPLRRPRRCRSRTGSPRRRVWLGRAASRPPGEVVGRGSSRTRSLKTNWNTCYNDHLRPSRCPSPLCTLTPPSTAQHIPYTMSNLSTQFKSGISSKHFCFIIRPCVFSALEIFLLMRYINRRFTLLYFTFQAGVMPSICI